MATTVDWANKIINVLRADMLLIQSVPTEIRELDIDTFRLELKALEASGEGMPFIDTHNNNPPVTVGGVTLARVIEIINGYTVTFEDGQYAVNLAGANSNIGDVTNVNQVSIRSANSAGLTYSKEVEDQSFTDARIWIDTINGLSGTQFPRGTPGDPVSNLDDAQSIILARNMPKRIHLRGVIILDSGDNISGYDFEGASAELATIDFGNSTSDEVVISGIDLSGESNGILTAKNTSSFSTFIGFEGQMVNGGLGGTTTLGGDGSNSYQFIDCHSDETGDTLAIIDCNNIANLSLSIRGFDGGVRIINVSESGSQISVDLNSGHCHLDSSVTIGDIVVRGSGYITDDSGVGATVSILGLSFGTSGLTPTESAQLGQIDIVRKLFMNRMETNPTTGIMTIYDDDDISVLYSGNIYEDVLATQIYRGSGIERRNRLT